MATALYLDTSAFLRRIFLSRGADLVDTSVASYHTAGADVVSSRLLWLEAKRVAIRESLRGNDIYATITTNLTTISKLPVTEEIWALAEAIGQHIKTLDSLHVATCELVGADLITFDATMRSVAQARGIHVVQ